MQKKKHFIYEIVHVRSCVMYLYYCINYTYNYTSFNKSKK